MKFVCVASAFGEHPPRVKIGTHLDCIAMAASLCKASGKAEESRYHDELLTWGRRAKAGDRLTVDDGAMVFAVPDASKHYAIKNQPALAVVDDAAADRIQPPKSKESRKKKGRNLAPRDDEDYQDE